MKNFKKLFLFSVLFISNGLFANSILLHYLDRPPYFIKKLASNDTVTVEGIISKRINFIADKSGIKFKWAQVPWKRTLLEIENNMEKICSPSAFKTPEREKFGKYSSALYQDLPAVVVTRPNMKEIGTQVTLKELLTNKKLKLLVKAGFSYGVELDKLLKKYKPTLIESYKNPSKHFKMITLERADYMFAAPEEVEGQIKASGFSKNQFKLSEIKDAPQGNKRYLFCSKKVTDKEIEEINKALAEFHRKK